MSSTVYTDFQPPAVNAAWLNDVNTATYNPTFPGLSSTTDATKGTALIGYLPAGITGAVGRTLSVRLKDAISVKDFGATGDGVTSDTVAIQAAANAAVGKVLFFPPGVYVVPDGFSVSGPGTKVIGYGATLTYNQTSASFYHCVRITGDNCSVAGLTIKSPNTLVRGQTGFGISVGTVGTKTYNVTIEDCYLESIALAAIWVSNVNNMRVVNNTIRYCKADGIHLSDGCFGSTIANNILEGNGDDNIAIVHDGSTPSTGLVGSSVIDGNYILGGTAGTGIALIGAFGVVVSNNYIINTWGPGIATYTWHDVTPSSRSANLLITGNNLSNTGAGSGSSFGGCGISLGDTQSVTVNNNSIHNLAYNSSLFCGAIRCTSATDLTINGNDLYDNACDHVLVTVATLQLSIIGNRFGYTPRTSVLLSGTIGEVSVVGNAFSGTIGTYDVNINLPSARVAFLHNKVIRLVLITCNNPTTVYDPQFLGNVSIVGSLSAGNYPDTPTAYTTAITAASGTFSNASIISAYYIVRGKMVFVDIYYNIAASGTASNSMNFVVPLAISPIAFLTAVGNSPNGKALVGFYLSSTSVGFNLYDSTTPCTITGGGHVSFSYMTT